MESTLITDAARPQPPGHMPLMVTGDGGPKAAGIRVTADSRRITSLGSDYQHVGLEVIYEHTIWYFMRFQQLTLFREEI